MRPEDCWKTSVLEIVSRFEVDVTTFTTDKRLKKILSGGQENSKFLTSSKVTDLFIRNMKQKTFCVSV